jgi:hypothetical protein
LARSHSKKIALILVFNRSSDIRHEVSKRPRKNPEFNGKNGFYLIDFSGFLVGEAV